eukprot:TRINITY_DN1442_c0_g1_i2.p1 TRINITY_DN1442_c0_g1~~TRINITY_DN1442_c0_g1_i2.p1  ORF type:complete len:204 (-),score=47.91 TRINITY_DN1442_c0_g1_i2:99-710(-)
MGVFFFFKQKTAYEIMPSLVGSEMCIRDRVSTQSTWDDDAGGADQGVVPCLFEIGCCNESTLGQMLAQQGQWMCAQRQAEATVIGNQVFTLVRCRQFDFCFDHGGCIEQVALNDCGGGCPGGLPTMAGQSLQGVSRGQQIKFAPLQASSRSQISDIQKCKLGYKLKKNTEQTKKKKKKKRTGVGAALQKKKKKTKKKKLKKNC